MKLKSLPILFFVSITSLTLSAQNTSSSFKIVGYYPIDQAMKVIHLKCHFLSLLILISLLLTLIV